MPKQKKRKNRTQKNVNRQPDQKRMQRDVKDRLFRYLFEKDRDALLELYNALNGTDYRDPWQLEIVTIESAVYVVMKNDLAYILYPLPTVLRRQKAPIGDRLGPDGFPALCVHYRRTDRSGADIDPDCSHAVPPLSSALLCPSPDPPS